MDFTATNNYNMMDSHSNESHTISSESSQRKENEFSLDYFSEKLTSYESNINNSYSNIKQVLDQLEEEFPEIDITNFSDFLSICEEYFNLLQDAQQVVEKALETNDLNDKLQEKIDKLAGEKIILKSSNKASKDEIKFRDYQIKKIENEMNLANKEYLDLLNKYTEAQNIKHESIPSIKNIENLAKENFLSGEALALKQENQILKKENSSLTRSLENLQNDLRSKYIPKAETEKKIAQLESESNYYMSKLKISEGNFDQLKRQMKNVSSDHDELKKELQESEKRFDEYRNSIRPEYYDPEMENRETPLNLGLISEDTEEGEVKAEAVVIPRATFTKLRRESEEEDVTRFSVRENENVGNARGAQDDQNSAHILQEPEEKKNTPHLSINNHPVFKIYDKNFVIPELENEDKISNKSSNAGHFNALLHGVDLNSSQASEDRKSEKKFSISLTGSHIVKQMSLNDFNKLKPEVVVQDIPYIQPKKEKEKLFPQSDTDIRKLNNKDRLKRFSTIIGHTADKGERLNLKRGTLLKSNNKEDTYKDFFNLTYQSYKLNSADIEPYLYLSSDKLYKASVDNCIPFHKFNDFIKTEIKKCYDKIYSKSNYEKKKYETVLDFIAAKLF